MFLKLKTYLFILCALALVFAIYFFENEVDSIRAEVASKKSEIQKYKQEISMLEAEWSYQNNPERLGELMFRLYWKDDMSTPKYVQFTEFNDLPEKQNYFSKLSLSSSSSVR